MADAKIREFIQNGSLDAIKEAVKIGVNLNTLEETMQDNYLHLACYFDKTGKIVEYLLEKAVNPNQQNKGGVVPLIYAVLHNTAAVVQIVATHKTTNPDLVDLSKKNAMMHAVENGYLDKVNALLKRRGINLEIPNIDGETPLQKAVESGQFDIVGRLLKKGAKSNIQNIHTGNSLVHTAVIKQDLKTFDHLLSWKAPTDLQNHEKNTALHIAASHGDTHLEFTKKLAKKSYANVKQQGKDGHTPLHLAIHAPACEKTIKELLYYNKDAKQVTNHQGKTAKVIATELGRLDLLKLL